MMSAKDKTAETLPIGEAQGQATDEASDSHPSDEVLFWRLEAARRNAERTLGLDFAAADATAELASQLVH